MVIFLLFQLYPHFYILSTDNPFLFSNLFFLSHPVFSLAIFCICKRVRRCRVIPKFNSAWHHCGQLWQEKDWYANFHQSTPVTVVSNVSTSSQTIHKDTRIGQLVITPVVIADFVLDLGEERGTRAFGSTGE